MSRAWIVVAVFSLAACGDGDSLASSAVQARSRAPDDVPPELSDAEPLGQSASASEPSEPTPDGDGESSDDGTEEGKGEAADAALSSATVPSAPIEMDASSSLDAGAASASGERVESIPIDAENQAPDGSLAITRSIVREDASAILDSATQDGDALVADADAASTPPQHDASVGDVSLESQVLARMRACQAISEGEFHLPAMIDDYGRCSGECWRAASCSELRHFMCGEDAAEITVCMASCPLEPVRQPFQCGDGQVVWLGFACDGLVNCADGSDEAACSPYLCADGTSVAGPARCNGIVSCSDGSDERGCASMCPSQSPS